MARTIDKIRELKDSFQLSDGGAELYASHSHCRSWVCLVHGRIEFEGGSAEELNNNDLIRQFYLGAD